MPITRYNAGNDPDEQKNEFERNVRPEAWLKETSDEPGALIGDMAWNTPDDDTEPMERRTPSPRESRHDLIERIKKEQKPSLCRDVDHKLSEHERARQRQTVEKQTYQPALLPPLDMEVSDNDRLQSSEEYFQPSSPIERPRSALHAGDFRPTSTSGTDVTGKPPDSPRPLQHAKQDFWPGTSPPRLEQFPRYNHERTNPVGEGKDVGADVYTPFGSTQARSFASSISSLSSSFAFRPPTSPLAHQSNSTDLEEDSLHRARSRSPNKGSRRRTFSPGLLNAFEHSRVPLRREGTYPYQAHQPRRSMGSVSSSHSISVPHTPSAYKRRPSQGSESSPLQRAPMVGRYEESILRGRMSTLPSKPFDFVAKIGVLGKGKCKPSLRCPPHVSIPFPAVFYDYGSRRVDQTFSPDGPSPYVGMIDLENCALNETTGQSTNGSSSALGASNQFSNGNGHSEEGERPIMLRRGKRVPKIDSTGSSSKPSKGAYRIPQQGQVQVIIKNPNNTAVKLFLVPYDLSDMEPHQKTFVRQRSYSAGPIIDMSATRHGDSSETRDSKEEDPNDRPVLRYLIHLHMCSTSRGRFYLYKSIRVVFANRVPDGKEKLRNEIQLPEPRYSSYRPDPPRRPPAIDTARGSVSPAASYPGTVEVFGSLPTDRGDSQNPHRFTVDGPAPDPFRFPKEPLQLALSTITSRSSGSDGSRSSRKSDDSQSSLVSPMSNRMNGHDRPVADESPSQNSFAASRTSPPSASGLLAIQLRQWTDSRNGTLDRSMHD